MAVEQLEGCWLCLRPHGHGVYLFPSHCSHGQEGRWTIVPLAPVVPADKILRDETLLTQFTQLLNILQLLVT